MDFQVNLKLLWWFLASVQLESFIKFPVNPYYEPLSWFMIIIIIINNQVLNKTRIAVKISSQKGHI